MNFHRFQAEAYDLLSQIFDEAFLKQQPLFFGYRTDKKGSRKRASLNSKALNDLFEDVYWSDNSNSKGAVFTPPSLVQQLVEVLSLSRNSSKALSLLDPACGGGILLSGALSDLNFLSAKEAISFVSRSLFGIDRDPVAVEVSRLSILITLYNLFPDNTEEVVNSFPLWKTNIVCGNALLKRSAEDFPAFDSIDLNTLFPQIAAQGGFTHVIANPPYGLSRDQQIPSSELVHLKEIYRDYLHGKPNKYMLFMLRIHQLLQVGGTFSLLVPNSWLGIKSATKLRRHLLEEGSLRKIISPSTPEFPNRGVEVVIVAGERRKKSSFETVQHVNSSTPSIRKATHLRKDLLQRPGGEIPLGWTDETRYLWSTIQDHSVPMTSSSLELTPMIALQVYSKGKGTPPQTEEIVREHPFHSQEYTSEDQARYLKGRDVRRYGLAWSGEFLRYGPWVSEYQPRERFDGPRILMREVLGSGSQLFQATYSDEPYFYNRSILHIIPDTTSEDPERTCLALLALLNSPIGSFYLQSQGRKCQRGLFPKIVNDDLKDFPIPKEFCDAKEELSQRALQILNAEDREQNELAINDLALKLYGLRESIQELNSQLAA